MSRAKQPLRILAPPLARVGIAFGCAVHTHPPHA
jgi:hypothetical protein